MLVQSAGRLIRSGDDAGVAVLIDSRFHTAAYRALFPPHWSQMRRVRDTASLRRLLAAFPDFSAEPEQPPSGEERGAITQLFIRKEGDDL